MNYYNDNTNEVGNKPNVISNNINKLTGSESHSETLVITNSNISKNDVVMHSYVSSDKVNTYDFCGVRDANYGSSGLEYYPHQKVSHLSVGNDSLNGCNHCDVVHYGYGNVGCEYYPQPYVYNAQLNRFDGVEKHRRKFSYFVPQENAMKPMNVYNKRREISHTIMTYNQFDINNIGNPNDRHADQKIQNVNGQYLYIFDQQIWFENQWSNITYIQGNSNQDISGFYICVLSENGCGHRFIHYTTLNLC